MIRKTVSDLRSDARIFREWFEFVGRELASGLARSSGDLATKFCENGELLDGKPATATDRDAVAAALTISLAQFEACKLITSEVEPRFTPNLRLSVPERVAKLTAHGTQVLGWPAWRIEFVFQRHLLGLVLKRLWKPFAGAVGVAGVITTMLKFVMMWNTEQAAIAGMLAGVGGLVGHLLRSRV